MAHWYDSTGRAVHRIIGKNGKERDTDLRDARKLLLHYSVSAVLNIPDKRALNEWKQDQIILAAILDPYNTYEYTAETWRNKMLYSMGDISRKASSRGTEIHNKLENYYKTGEICKTDKDYIIPTIKLIEEEFPGKEWVAEDTFVSKKHGYGGCVDLHCEDIIIDFKTKDKTDIKDMKQYEEQKMQLAAYQAGLLLPENSRRFNIFISINPKTPGLCVLRECKEYDRMIKMFLLLNDFWKHKNKYYPGEE